MKPTRFLFLFLVSHAVASPLTQEKHHRRSVSGRKSNENDDSANHFVTLCADKVPAAAADDDKNAWGEGSRCRAAGFDVGRCAGIGGGMDGRVSAVDPRGFDCTFYAEPGCRGGRSLPAHRRPNGDLLDNGGLDDVLSSFMCWR